MTKEKPSSIERTLKLLGTIFGIVLILVSPWLSVKLTDLKETGAIGDTIGGVTSPLVGLLGALLVYFALKEQIKANELIADQFEEQKRITTRQHFEQTFFNMINIHHQIVMNISWPRERFLVSYEFPSEENPEFQKKVQKFHSKYGDKSKNNNEKPLESRYFFKFTIEAMIELISIMDEMKDADSITIEPENKEYLKNENYHSWFPTVYEDIFHRLDTYLGHYFRHLYRTVKMIDEQEFFEDAIKQDRMKREYAAIVRAQLSDYEIKWLFFNGLFNYGKNFKPFIEKYAMIRILGDSTDPVIEKLRKFYDDSAFYVD